MGFSFTCPTAGEENQPSQLEEASECWCTRDGGKFQEGLEHDNWLLGIKSLAISSRRHFPPTNFFLHFYPKNGSGNSKFVKAKVSNVPLTLSYPH